MRLRASFSSNFPQLCVSISITAGCMGLLGSPCHYILLWFARLRGEHVQALTWTYICSFKSLGECAGLISASLLGLLSVSPPLGLLVYLDEGGTWLKHAVALTAVLGGQNVTSLEESKWEKLGMEAELISRGRKLTAQWLHAHSVFTPLLHCSVWMMQSPE